MNKKLSIQKIKRFTKLKVLVMGISYKENCPDIRNSQILRIVKDIKNNKNSVYVFDPQIMTKNLSLISRREKFKLF